MKGAALDATLAESCSGLKSLLPLAVGDGDVVGEADAVAGTAKASVRASRATAGFDT